MKDFDTRAYSVADFMEWDTNGLLDLSPEFQRRSVWSTKAKSYLVDTIIRGKPIPKILITQSLKDRRNVRTVVDGQQRLRAILEFIRGDFKISRAHNTEYANHNFEMLPGDIRNDLFKYEIGVDLLFDMPFEDLLDVFARINTYTVKLNTQEKINAKYLGFFKKYAYRLGYKYVQYFIQGAILTKDQVARMKEAELSSDLLVSLCGGIQTNKNIEVYYKKYEEGEDDPEDLQFAADLFDETMKYIGIIYTPDQLKHTNWRRLHLFYTLFTSIAHGLNPLPDFAEVPRPKVSPDTLGKFRVKLDDLSARYDNLTKEGSQKASTSMKAFMDYSSRRTTDTSARRERTKFICNELSSF